jgi:ATP-dependent protease ClpP protease subunit
MKVSFGKKYVHALAANGQQVVNFGPDMNMEGSTVNLMVWGEISEWWGVNKNSVYWALRGKDIAHINVFISSEGGECNEAFVIHDMLKGHPATVTCYLVGWCCSSATVIACAGDSVVMSRQCLYMIHKPSFFMFGGNENDLVSGAEQLRKYQNIIVGVYARKTGLSTESLNELVNAETWLEPDEALSLGFVDSLADSIEVDFLLPEKNANAVAPNQQNIYWDYDEDDPYDAAKMYRVAACAGLSKGLRPATGADISKYVISNTRKKDSTTMSATTLFQKVVSALKGTGAIAQNADEAALAQTLSENPALVQEFRDETITATVNASVQSALSTRNAAEPPAMSDLLAAIKAASDDERKELSAALTPQGEGEGSTDEGETLEAIQQTIEDLTAKVANLSRSGAGQSASNGKSSATPGTKAEPSATSKAQKQIAIDSYQSNKISAAVYRQITGEEPPAKK